MVVMVTQSMNFTGAVTNPGRKDVLVGWRLAMIRKIENILSGKNLEVYQERCNRHPWYDEAQISIEEYGQKIRAMKAAGEDPTSLFDDPFSLHVDEVIGYAKATFDNPDMLWYWQDHHNRKKKTGKGGFSDKTMEVLRVFEHWYFLKQGKPPQDILLSAGRALIGAKLDGCISDLDGSEARRFALQQPYVKE